MNAINSSLFNQNKPNVFLEVRAQFMDTLLSYTVHLKKDKTVGFKSIPIFFPSH